MIRPGVAETDAPGVEGDLEDDPAAAAWAAGEDRPVVGQQAGRITIAPSGFVEAIVDVAGLEHRQGVAADADPGVIVEQVEDLYVGAVGECPAGDVELPALVGLLGGEP